MLMLGTFSFDKDFVGSIEEGLFNTALQLVSHPKRA